MMRQLYKLLASQKQLDHPPTPLLHGLTHFALYLLVESVEDQYKRDDPQKAQPWLDLAVDLGYDEALGEIQP